MTAQSQVDDVDALVQQPLPADVFGDLAQFASLGTQPRVEPAELVTLAVSAVTAAQHACLTLKGVNGRLRTLASTGAGAEELVTLQDDAGDGPALDRVDTVDVLRVTDLAAGAPWPRFVEAVVQCGIRSALTVRVPIDTLGVASLTFFASSVDAFDEHDAEIAAVCGSFLGVLLRSRRERERAENLEIALDTNRRIGTAIGVLMARKLLTADQAFEALREASQALHRKLRDVADDVVATGELPGQGAGHVNGASAT